MTVVKVRVPEGSLVKPLGPSNDSLLDQNEMRLSFAPETRFRVIGKSTRDLPRTSKGAVESQQSNAGASGSKLPDNQVLPDVTIIELEAIPPQSGGQYPVVDISPRLELDEGFGKELDSTARRFTAAYATLKATEKRRRAVGGDRPGAKKVDAVEASRQRARTDMYASRLDVLSRQVAYLPEYESQQILAADVMAASGVSRQLQDFKAWAEGEGAETESMGDLPRIPFLRETQRFEAAVRDIHRQSASEYVELEDKLLDVMDAQERAEQTLAPLRQARNEAQARVDRFSIEVPDPQDPSSNISWAEHILRLPEGESRDALMRDMEEAHEALRIANQKYQEFEPQYAAIQAEHDSIAEEMVRVNAKRDERLEAAQARYDAHRQTPAHAAEVAELRAQHNHSNAALQEAERVRAVLPRDPLAKVDFRLADATFRQAHLALEASELPAGDRLSKDLAEVQGFIPKIAELKEEKMRLLQNEIDGLQAYREKAVSFQAQRPDIVDPVAAAMMNVAGNREDLLRAEIQMLQARNDQEMSVAVRARDAALHAYPEGSSDVIRNADQNVYGRLRVPATLDAILEKASHEARGERFKGMRSLTRQEQEVGKPTEGTARRELTNRNRERLRDRDLAAEEVSPLMQAPGADGFGNPMVAPADDIMPVGSGVQPAPVRQAGWQDTTPPDSTPMQAAAA
jgi:hypothetical protein